MTSRVPVALISGPVGVGKTTVGEELSEQLARANVPHTFVDFDQLRYTYPHPADDRWGNRLGLANLADVWRNCAAAGSQNLVLSYVVEETDFLNELAAAVPGADVTCIQLSAEVATLHERLRRRELGSGLQWHLDRATELSRLLQLARTPADHRIATDGRSIADIAADVRQRVAWLSPV